MACLDCLICKNELEIISFGHFIAETGYMFDRIGCLINARRVFKKNIEFSKWQLQLTTSSDRLEGSESRFRRMETEHSFDLESALIKLEEEQQR